MKLIETIAFFIFINTLIIVTVLGAAVVRKHERLELNYRHSEGCEIEKEQGE